MVKLQPFQLQYLGDGYFPMEVSLTDPASGTGIGSIYTKEVDGYVELHYVDDYGMSTKITNKGGAIGGGGISQPDSNKPWLFYSDSASIDIRSAVSMTATIYRTLQDGTQRSFDSVLNWSFTNGVGELGLDAGAEASDTWYYLYLVPSAANNTILTAIASTSNPFIGPSGYTEFDYVGAFLNDSSSDIDKFYQLTTTLFRRVVWNHFQSEADPSADATPQTIDVSTLVPETAYEFYLSTKGWTGSGYVKVQWWIYGESTVEDEPCRMWWISGGDVAVTEKLPLPKPTKSYYQKRTDHDGGNLKFWEAYAMGWTDGYL